MPPEPARTRLARPAAIAGLASLGVLLVLYMPYEPGRFVDDYYWTDIWRFAEGGSRSLPHLLDAAFSADRVSGVRPAQRTLQAGTQWLAGPGAEPRLVVALLLAALECALLFAVLRLAGIGVAGAGSAAGLLAILPSIDATRLWFSSTYLTLAACLYLGGLVAAVKGLRADGRRARLGWHAGAVALYAAAATTELFLGVVAASAIVYLAVAGRSAALARWPADVFAVAGVGIPVGLAVNADRGGDLSPGHLLARAGEVLEGFGHVLRLTLPANELLWGPVGALLALLIAAGVVTAIRRGPPLGKEAERWLAAGGIGASLAAAGLIPLLPEIHAVIPTFSGIQDRIIAAAAPGAVVFVVSLGWLAAIAAAALLRRPRLVVPVAASILLVTCAPLVHAEREAQREWESASESQESVLAAVEAAGVTPGDAIVTLGHPVFTRHLVPVFVAIDLEYAIRLRFDEPRFRARPGVFGISCEPDGMRVVDPIDGPLDYPYGRLVLVRVDAMASLRVAARRDCVDALTRLGYSPP